MPRRKILQIPLNNYYSPRKQPRLWNYFKNNNQNKQQGRKCRVWQESEMLTCIWTLEEYPEDWDWRWRVSYHWRSLEWYPINHDMEKAVGCTWAFYPVPAATSDNLLVHNASQLPAADPCFTVMAGFNLLTIHAVPAGLVGLQTTVITWICNCMKKKKEVDFIFHKVHFPLSQITKVDAKVAGMYIKLAKNEVDGKKSPQGHFNWWLEECCPSVYFLQEDIHCFVSDQKFQISEDTEQLQKYIFTHTYNI